MKRVVIENVTPEVDCGMYPIKRVVGEKVVVRADIFCDGHDSISVDLLYRGPHEEWQRTEMKHIVNDRWKGSFTVKEPGSYYYTLRAWVNHFETWQKDLKKKYMDDQDVKIELLMGAWFLESGAEKARREGKKEEALSLSRASEQLLQGGEYSELISLALRSDITDLMRNYLHAEPTIYEKELEVEVDREQALFSSWYEIFPRSTGPHKKHGTFKDCQKLLPEIARMGFDVLYFPPIHPIGKTSRKGKNNSPQAEPDDPGSPWSIGSEEGGHKAIHPELGTMEDFEDLISGASELGMEVALDLAFQCSNDHPYIKEHPEWFLWRPDNTIQFAENPPKKYEDIVPINFETENWRELWEELKSVTLFWVEKGVRIFRVDNPHTKPFSFWEWLISEVKRDHPDVLFLSEAFTRPKVMYKLAKIGFTQSYTYFTWRNTKKELTDYLNDLTGTEVREYFRPNFWPNTPDILPEFLQYGGRPAFVIRLVLAATLSSNYGIYSPAFELYVREALPGREEYLHSEKYEIKDWDRDSPENLKDLLARINRIRRENPALQTTRNLRFYEVTNENLMCYEKRSEENILLIIVNLDPFHKQSGWIRVPLEDLKVSSGHPYLVHDLLSEDKYIWQKDWNFIEVDPHVMPASIFRLHRRLRREEDFDYFM